MGRPKMRILCILFAVGTGEWVSRAAHGSTGQVFMAIKNPRRDPKIYSWGPVCRGTGNRQIPTFNTRDFSNQQGQKFADELCKNMGFRSAEFLGPRDDYYKFMRKRKFEVPQLSVACKVAMPEYAIAGYQPCKSDCQDEGLSQWELKPYSITGGTCLAGKSDLFIDCKGRLPSGIWSDWIDQKYIDEDAYYRQQWRHCETPDGEIAHCDGEWLRLIPVERCINGTIEDEDYNYDLNYESDSPEDFYDSYSSSSSSSYSEYPTRRPRLKRACPNDLDKENICSCQNEAGFHLNTINQRTACFHKSDSKAEVENQQSSRKRCSTKIQKFRRCIETVQNELKQLTYYQIFLTNKIDQVIENAVMCIYKEDSLCARERKTEKIFRSAFIEEENFRKSNKTWADVCNKAEQLYEGILPNLLKRNCEGAIDWREQASRFNKNLFQGFNLFEN